MDVAHFCFHAKAELIQIAREGDVIVTMGAGSIGAAAAELPIALASVQPAPFVDRRRP